MAALGLVLAGCGLLKPPATGGGPAAASPARPPATPSSSVPYNVSGLRDPSSGKFLGLEADGAPGSLAPLTTFAANTGRKPNMVGQYVSWGRPFDATAASHAWSYGALYYMAWEPFGTSVQAIAAGNWYPWGTEQATPAQFVAAWRHIHRLFTRAGASNVIWVWNPNIINPMPTVRLRPYWPGHAYVDWVGMTGYFATTGPHDFATLYRPTMIEIRHFTRKPFIIAETAIESGPAEVACVRQLVDTVTRHRNVLGFIWFDYDKNGVDWRVESRPAVRAALAGDIATLPLVNPRT
jgi:hypothetical protein